MLVDRCCCFGSVLVSDGSGFCNLLRLGVYRAAAPSQLWMDSAAAHEYGLKICFLSQIGHDIYLSVFFRRVTPWRLPLGWVPNAESGHLSKRAEPFTKMDGFSRTPQDSYQFIDFERFGEGAELWIMPARWLHFARLSPFIAAEPPSCFRWENVAMAPQRLRT